MKKESSRERNEEVVWESYHINGMGQHVTHEFLICDSFQTAEKIIDEVINEEYSDESVYNVVRNRNDHYAHITYSNCEFPGDSSFHLTLCCYEHKVINSDDVDRMMEETREKKRRKELERDGIYTVTINGEKITMEKSNKR